MPANPKIVPIDVDPARPGTATSLDATTPPTAAAPVRAGRPESPQLPTASATVIKVILGCGIMALALATSTQLGVESATAGLWPASLVPAAFVAIVVVALIILIRTRVDKKPLYGIGLTGTRSVAASGGAALLLMLGIGTFAFVITLALGFIEVTSFSAPDLMQFLAINTVLALLFEAIPEEIAVRGYVVTALRSRMRRGFATALSILAFIIVALTSGLLMGTFTQLRAVIGGGTFDASQISLAPAGQDPIVYVITLSVFGLMLVYAREATMMRSIGTCIGAHLGFLTVMRVYAGGASNTGLDVELTLDGQAVIFAIIMALACTTFALLRARANRRRASLEH